MPGELTPHRTVAIYRGDGFENDRVDRQLRVRAGDVIATLDAPELNAHAAVRAQSKVARSRRNSPPVRRSKDADVAHSAAGRRRLQTSARERPDDARTRRRPWKPIKSRAMAAQRFIRGRASFKHVDHRYRTEGDRARFDGVVAAWRVSIWRCRTNSSGAGAATPMVRRRQCRDSSRRPRSQKPTRPA